MGAKYKSLRTLEKLLIFPKDERKFYLEEIDYFPQYQTSNIFSLGATRSHCLRPLCLEHCRTSSMKFQVFIFYIFFSPRNSRVAIEIES